DRSLVRVLLGGKATVTARERSVLTITEVPGVSTIHLDEGRISVAVSKALMKPGERVDIQTPNAVTAIRGTVVVAEVSPGTSIQSTISVLRGLVEVTRLDSSGPAGNSVNVGAFQMVTVVGSKPLPQASKMSANDVNRLTADFRIVPSGLAPGASAVAVDIAKQNAMDDAAIPAAVHKAGGKTTGVAAGTKKQKGGEPDGTSSDEKGNDHSSRKAKHKGTENTSDSSSSSAPA